jgi:NADH-quinone oxidoreductase subunit A
MTEFVAYFSLFIAIAVFFLFIHLVMGRFLRPVKPDPEKLTIYECGEPTIGSSWIQFDLRFYVVALLFVIFDVEVVFFFPWAVVFGKANQLSRAWLVKQTTEQGQGLSIEERQIQKLSSELVPASERMVAGNLAPEDNEINAAGARQLAWMAFWDILVFFGVVLVGFAYLWKRGDLDWVRSTLAERLPDQEKEPTIARPDGELVAAGRG